MPLFLIQCVAGLQDFVADQLISDFPPGKTIHTEEGLLIFSVSTFDHSKIEYANNVFLVLQSPKGSSMEALIDNCLKEKTWPSLAKSSIQRNEKCFRLFLSDEGKLVSTERDKLDRMTTEISRVCGIPHTSHRPDTEFWLFRRRGGQGYLCKRLTQNRLTEKDLKPGELRPELANILCLMSEPSEKDIFIDPFAGSGAIISTRRKRPSQMIFASDIDDKKVTALKKLSRQKPPVIIRTANALKLDKIENGFIDKVVTDPPWGLFDKSIKDIGGFYEGFMKEACRITKPDGIIVMLTAQKVLVDKLSDTFSHMLTPESRFDILVSGKKAAIVKWRRSYAPQ